MICYREPGAETARERMLRGVRFRCEYVRRGVSLLSRRQARAAARKLRSEGIAYALAPEDYPYRAELMRRGIVPPPVLPLYCASAEAVVRFRLEQVGAEPRRSRVTLAAEYVTAELRALAFALCGDVRYLSLAVAAGAGELADELRRLRGVAVQTGPPERLPPAALTAAFGGARAFGEVLRFDETLCVAYDGETSNELLAAMLRAGVLDVGRLRVRSVEQRWPS